jgi:hypothetical protein
VTGLDLWADPRGSNRVFEQRDRGEQTRCDTTRQVPAKRSNIMSILNDEPEEPQPRKRFASEQAPSAHEVTGLDLWADPRGSNRVFEQRDRGEQTRCPVLV